MRDLFPLKSGPSAPPSPFCQIASGPLDQVSYGACPPGDYIRLSGVLQVCAYLYETGAVLGRARRDEVPRLLEVLVDQDNEDCRPAKLRWSLRTRLERTSRQCKSLSTFYLYRTMIIIGLDFSVEGMKQAHNEPRMRGELWQSLDLAAAEGLTMGASFPDLTSQPYNKDFDAEHPAIVEMKAHGVAATDEIGEPDIDRRTGIVLRKLKKFASWL